MAIGDTVQAGLMRVDSSPILLAGQAQAKANQAFGDALGGAVEKFYQKKKDKQEREQRERAYREAGLNAEEAKAASGDKELGSLLINKMNADRNFFLAQQEVLIEKEKEKRAADQFDLEKRDYENRFKERKRLLSEAKELKESQLKLDQFLTERPKKPTPEFSNLQKQFSLDQIPGTPEFKQKELSDPMGARPPLMASVATDKPNFKMFNVGKSEAVARLPESFQPEGKRVIDAVESGRLTPREGMSLINQIQAQALAEQKAAPSLKDILEIQNKDLDIDIKTKEFQQKQDAISFNPKRNYLDLGEVRFGISGKFGDEAEVIKIKSEAIPNYQKMNAVMNELIRLGEVRKKQKYMSNADKVLAESLSRQLQGLLREDILGPGTVTEPERAILEQIIQNPTQWFDFKGKTDDKIRSLKGVRKKAFNTLKSRLSGLGLDVTELGQGGSTLRPSKSPNMQNQTDSGLGYEFVPLDEL
jgi:hypothetical protein